MKTFVASILAAALLLPGAPALAQKRTDQGEARKEMRAGTIMRSRDIEARVLPQMRDHEYLGFAYDSAALAYRLKFIREGRVTYVDVDARSGRLLGISR